MRCEHRVGYAQPVGTNFGGAESFQVKPLPSEKGEGTHQPNGPKVTVCHGTQRLTDAAPL
jgi:hypothetical protein